MKTANGEVSLRTVDDENQHFQTQQIQICQIKTHLLLPIEWNTTSQDHFTQQSMNFKMSKNHIFLYFNNEFTIFILH